VEQVDYYWVHPKLLQEEWVVVVEALHTLGLGIVEMEGDHIPVVVGVSVEMEFHKQALVE